MARLVLLPAILLFNCVASAQEFFSDIGQEVTEVLSLVELPVGEAILGAIFSQCQNVKNLIGVQYDQLAEAGKEPDANILKIDYLTVDNRFIFNINNVSRELPLIPEFQSQGKIVLFFHGFTDNPTKDTFLEIANAFHERGGFAVLALDGSPLTNWFYLRSSTYAQFIGVKVAEMLASMVEEGTHPDDIILVGQSLGSHIAGFTGKSFKKITGQKIGRITHLDPANPCFSDVVQDDLKLNKDDAKYVDVIHTNAGIFGLKENLGHADYWVNGGSIQPGCTSSCSHSRSVVFYAESVTNPASFPAIKCKDWYTFKANNCSADEEISYMGLPSNGEGVFYLRTGAEMPYGLGISGIMFDQEEQSFGGNVFDTLFG